MSNKPDIFAFCKANCKWKTVHYDEWERSASLIKQTAANNIYFLKKGQEYKIFSDNDSIKYTATITYRYKYYETSTSGDDIVKEGTYTFPVVTYNYFDSFKFALLKEYSPNPSKLQLVYEVNGNQTTINLDVNSPQLDLGTSIEVTNANYVYLYRDGDIALDYGIVKITDVTANAWATDDTYIGYGYSYKCTIPISGFTSDMVAEVIFGCTEAVSGNYAPVCETYDGGVYIYSKVNTAITIPTILVVK